MMPTDYVPLAVLARIDALFWPLRAEDVNRRRVAAERRAAYREYGLPWLGSGSEAVRKAAVRELDALAEVDRLLTRRHPGRLAVHVVLTDDEENTLRGRCCIDTYATALPLLDAIAALLASGLGYQQTGLAWLRETTVAASVFDAELANEGKALGCLAEGLLPLLSRGLVESNADRYGRVWFAATAAGSRLAAKRLASGAIDEAATSPEPDPGERRRYLAAMDAALDELASAEPSSTRDIGLIPMPVGVSDRPQTVTGRGVSAS